MKAILQRVVSASVTVDKQLISSIGKGVLVFAAVGPDDTRKDAESMASKVLRLKMWEDEAGATWKRSVQDIQGEVLCVSQFTILASTKKGSKPDFHGAAKGEMAKELYDAFFAKVQELYDPMKVKDGVFQAMMEVGLVNDGPVGADPDTDPPVPFVDYCSEDGAVTLEIQTNPSKNDGPLGQKWDPPPWDPQPLEVNEKKEVKRSYEKTASKLPQELLD